VNAVRWQCDLLASSRARALNVTLFLATALGMQLLPWPTLWASAKTLLILAMMIECGYNERRLRRRCGRLMLDEENHWHWQGKTWSNARQPIWLAGGVLLVLRNAQGERWQLWLMQDNLPPRAWRSLRACFFMQARAAGH